MCWFLSYCLSPHPPFHILLCDAVPGNLQTLFLPVRLHIHIHTHLCQQGELQGDWKAGGGSGDLFLPLCLLDPAGVARSMALLPTSYSWLWPPAPFDTPRTASPASSEVSNRRLLGGLGRSAGGSSPKFLDSHNPTAFCGCHLCLFSVLH